MEYYPKGTIFVTVIDPGVGTERKSIVAKTKTGYYVVTPDNGIITYIDSKHKIDKVREIDATKHSLANYAKSHTFHGRDLYAYTAAKLASRQITLEQVGKEINSFVKIPLLLPSYNYIIVSTAIFES